MSNIRGGKTKRNYNLLRNALQEVGNNAVQSLIDFHLNTEEITLPDLIDEYGHVLYHLYKKNKNRCCQCACSEGKGQSCKCESCESWKHLPTNPTIDKRQFNILFNRQSWNRKKRHSGGIIYDCCCLANTSLRTNDLDITLGSTILLHCCQNTFWRCCLEAKNKSFEDFLKENKHDIYHMCYPDGECTLCLTNPLQSRKKLIILKDDWESLFTSAEKTGSPTKYKPNSDITISDLKSDLSYTLICAFCETAQAIKSLRDLRNEVCHHPKSEMESTLFEELWAKVESNILLMAKLCGKEKELEEQLNTIKISKESSFFGIKLAFDNGRRIMSEFLQLAVPRHEQEMTVSTSVYDKEANNLHISMEQADDEKYVVIVLNGTVQDTTVKLDADTVHIHYGAKNSKNQKRETDLDEVIYQREPDNTSLAIGKDIFDPEDVFKCACGQEYNNLSSFYNHKSQCIRTSKGKQKTVFKIRINLSGDGMSDEHVIEIVKYSRRESRSTKDIHFLDEMNGSLIIWAKTSLAVFGSKEIFADAIEKFIGKIFFNLPAEHDTPKEIKICVEITEDTENGDSDIDECDSFQCGKCLKEFFVLEAFVHHKMRGCERRWSNIEQAKSCLVEVVPDSFKYFQYLKREIEDLHKDNETGLHENLQSTFPIAFCIADESIDLHKTLCEFGYMFSTRKLEYQHDVFNGPQLAVVVCVLTTPDFHLTEKDKEALLVLKRDFLRDCAEKVIFAVTCNEFMKHRNAHILSFEISSELECKINDIYSRLYTLGSLEMKGRIELYVQQQILGQSLFVHRVHDFADAIEKESTKIKSKMYDDDFQRTLMNGCLNYIACLHFCQNSSRNYHWQGASVLRNRGTVIELKKDITKHICKELSTKMVEELMDTLKEKLQSIDVNFGDIIYRHIDIDQFKDLIAHRIIIYVFAIILEGLKEVVMYVYTVIVGVNVDAYGFRNGISSDVHEQIIEHRDRIINLAIEKFIEACDQPFFELAKKCREVHELLEILVEKKKEQNREESVITEFAALKRNSKIRRVLYDNLKKQLCVYSDAKDAADVKEFIDFYSRVPYSIKHI